MPRAVEYADDQCLGIRGPMLTSASEEVPIRTLQNTYLCLYATSRDTHYRLKLLQTLRETT